MTTNLDAVYSLAGSADALYAARSSGLYRSYDGGATWHNTFTSLDQALAAVAVTAVGQTVFAGVKGAVLRSDDGGDTWKIVGLASPPPLVVALAISPTYKDDGIVFAGTAEDGVFLSTDRGETWIAWNFALLDLNVYALAVSPAFAQDRTLFAGTESGIFISTNGGRGWRETAFPMDAAPVLCLALSADGTLFAGTESHGLHTSDDSGASWRQITPDAAVHAIHAGAAITALLDDSVLRSDDSGRSWADTPFQPDQSAMTLLTYAPDHVLVGFADGAVQHITP